MSDVASEMSLDVHCLCHSRGARILAKDKADFHVDLGFCLPFVDLIFAFVTIESHDDRLAEINLLWIRWGSADIIELYFSDRTNCAFSCVHVVDHIGLEHCGCPFDPKCAIEVIDALSHEFADKGMLFFVVPIDYRSRIQYKAQRIYTYEQVVKIFPLPSR